MRIHCLENVDKALQFLKEQKVHLENMGSHDIVDGNHRLTLGLIWTIILRFQVRAGTGRGGASASDLMGGVGEPDTSQEHLRRLCLVFLHVLWGLGLFFMISFNVCFDLFKF